MEDRRWGLTARTWGVCVWRELVGVAGGTRHLVVKMVMVAMVMTKVMMMTVVMMIFNIRSDSSIVMVFIIMVVMTVIMIIQPA